MDQHIHSRTPAQQGGWISGHSEDSAAPGLAGTAMVGCGWRAKERQRRGEHGVGAGLDAESRIGEGAAHLRHSSKAPSRPLGFGPVRRTAAAEPWNCKQNVSVGHGCRKCIAPDGRFGSTCEGWRVEDAARQYPGRLRSQPRVLAGTAAAVSAINKEHGGSVGTQSRGAFKIPLIRARLRDGSAAGPIERWRAARLSPGRPFRRCTPRSCAAAKGLLCRTRWITAAWRGRAQCLAGRTSSASSLPTGMPQPEPAR